MKLKKWLLNNKKNRWVNIGCGDNFDDNFFYLDIFPYGVIGKEYKDRYFRGDIVNMDKDLLSKMGKFDFLRMQHVFEHFTPEDGQKALMNCARLLKPGGIILITTPDLKIHVNKYLTNKYDNLPEFKWWAERRIKPESPSSFYFSIFSHGISYGGEHKWCYDYEGLKFQLKKAGKFKDIRQLSLKHTFAEIPFTHNRPEEDLCVIATKTFL